MRRLVLVGLMALVLMTAAGCGLNRSQTTRLVRDVSGHPAYTAVVYLVNQGAVQGYRDGSFKPDRPVTRAEFITMINRAFRLTGETAVPYADVAPGAWYYQEVARAAAALYLPDWPAGQLAPDTPLTRGEAAVMMARVLALPGPAAAATPISDLNDLAPAWQDPVVRAVAAGLLELYPGQAFHPAEPVSRGQAAVLVRSGLKLHLPSVGMIDVKDQGARGDGQADDTAPIQQAVDKAADQGGGTVYIPGGVYCVDADRSIIMASHVKLSLAPDAVLKARPSARENSAVILIYDVEDVTVAGGSIVGDRQIHAGSSGEWGMGISILGSSQVHIADVDVSDCWGDGIYIGSTPRQPYCQEVTVERFSSVGNRRQGMSVISAKDLTIKDGVITGTNGIDPQAGLNVEPNLPSEFVQGVRVEKLLTAGNAGYGILVALGPYKDSPSVVTLTVRGHTDVDSARGAISDYRYFQRNPGYQVQFDIDS